MVQCFSKILNLQLLDDCSAMYPNFIWRIQLAVDVKKKNQQNKTKNCCI